MAKEKKAVSTEDVMQWRHFTDKSVWKVLLGIEKPWRVSSVEVEIGGRIPGRRVGPGPLLLLGTVRVRVSHSRKGKVKCPVCGASCVRHDHRERSWRHLDTMQFATLVTAVVPRAKCEEHGVHQLPVPWAEEHSRFTAFFESLVIGWLLSASASAVAGMMRLSWDQVDGIYARAVRRGLSRVRREVPRAICVDETSFRRGRKYVTVVSDASSGEVLHVAEGRGRESLESYYENAGADGCARLEHVMMDMWQPYIAATQSRTGAAVVFDKFHIAHHLSAAVDQVRRREHRRLRRQGDERLTGTRYLWLRRVEKMSETQRSRFESLRREHLTVGRAWAMKEMAMEQWGYATKEEAHADWKHWLSWVRRSRLGPMQRVAETIGRHLEGVLNAAVTGFSNAKAESINARIQQLKRRSCGYRSVARMRNAILFHLGGLDLYPENVPPWCRES